jgi:putative Holliday junction resolvase
MPGMHETILAFDFGLRRIGVAVGQQVTGSANPLGVINNGDSGPDWNRITKLHEEWQPARLVVGMPSHADGSRAPIADDVDSFIKALGRFELPIETVDERFTSTEAAAILKFERAMGRRKRIKKEHLDSTSAVLIAESWLRNASGSG